MLNYTVKYSLFVIYGVAVFLFVHFLNISHLSSIFIDWLLNDVEDGQIYDYIIVGAGSAGATLAARLFDAGNKILLIEAGGPPPYFANIPVLGPLLQRSPYDWQYKTEPQAHACKGLINNQSSWPMGKVLGGSSRLNYMAYVKGHPNDYLNWFPDYDKFGLDNDSISNGPRYCTELCDSFLKAIDEISQKDQGNNEYKLDFWRVNLSMSNGERWSTDKLLKTRHKGLKVLTYSYVEKIKFQLKKAEGVEFTKWGKHFDAIARKGVIVSAGAIGTPKLLMLSGIGPKDHLKALNIKVVEDLPVGENLMDHITTGVDLVTLKKTLSVSLAGVLAPKAALDYFISGQGPWTSSGIEVVGTLHDVKNHPDKPPDIQFMVLPIAISQDNGVALKNALGVSNQIFDEYFAPLAYRTAITIAPVLLHPKSLGEVKLKSSDPLDDPIIDPKYLSDKDDVAVLIRGIKFIEKIVNTESMKALGASIYKKPFPGCEKFEFSSTNYWECYIRHLTLTSYHPVGTCKMGSVVDKSFQVMNMENLYIVDASVLPKLPSGNTNAVVMMLAEKASNLIGQSSKINIASIKYPINCHKYDFIKEIFFLAHIKS